MQYSQKPLYIQLYHQSAMKFSSDLLNFTDYILHMTIHNTIARNGMLLNKLKINCHFYSVILPYRILDLSLNLR